MQSRSPVVAILGHVDHGKTTLLDYIRKSRIAKGEEGGITQKIGAYEAETGIRGYPINKITFIDTPGHEAFSLLRARGANVADIAILLIDGKDSVMPQSIESISHIKAAGIPYIVVINKIDLEDVDIEKVKNDLLKYEVMVEGKGGDVPVVPLSAKTGKGVNDLLETILFISSDKKLEYDPFATPHAYIIETKKDRRGIVMSVIIKNGMLKIGDTIYADQKKARIRALINDIGENIQSVSPSSPFELLGFEEAPSVGSEISSVLTPLKEVTTDAVAPLETAVFDMATMMAVPKIEKKLALVIKSDSQGSLEVIHAALVKNEHVDILLSAVGDIHKSDIFLAKTAKAIVIGFNVKPDPETKDLAKQEKVIIKTYGIIYELLDELNEVADLLQEKEEQEKHLKGEAKIIATFTIEGEKVLGVKMTKGKITSGDEVQLHRGDNLIGKMRLVSLQVRSKKVQEVKKDQESGMVFSPPLDIRVGDVVKCIL